MRVGLGVKESGHKIVCLQVNRSVLVSEAGKDLAAAAIKCMKTTFFGCNYSNYLFPFTVGRERELSWFCHATSSRVEQDRDGVSSHQRQQSHCPVA